MFSQHPFLQLKCWIEQKMIDVVLVSFFRNTKGGQHVSGFASYDGCAVWEMCKSVKLIRDEDGLVLLELAIVLPILLLIVFGIIQLSLVYNARMVTAYATYVGAREVAVGGDTFDARRLTEVIMSSLDLRILVPGMSAFVLDTEFVKQKTNVEARVGYRMPIRVPMVQEIFDFWGSLGGMPSKEVGCFYELRRE